MSDSKLGGISTTNRSSPLSIFGSISEALMCTGGWNVARLIPSAIRRDRSEPSSSTMPTERLVASVTAPVATVLTEMLNEYTTSNSITGSARMLLSSLMTRWKMLTTWSMKVRGFASTRCGALGAETLGAETWDISRLLLAKQGQREA